MMGDHSKTSRLPETSCKGKTYLWLEKHLDYEGDDCLEWPYYDNGYGYGAICIKRKMYSVHRLVCQIKHGPPPTPSHQAAHTCGNRLCVNPSHLRWATRKENEQDKIAHGKTLRGERSSTCKLTELKVRAIRKMRPHFSRTELSKIFEVSRGTIGDIVSRRTWYWMD